MDLKGGISLDYYLMILKKKIPITSRFFNKFTFEKLSSTLINNEKDINKYLLKLQSKDYDIIKEQHVLISKTTSLTIF